MFLQLLLIWSFSSSEADKRHLSKLWWKKKRILKRVSQGVLLSPSIYIWFVVAWCQLKRSGFFKKAGHKDTVTTRRVWERSCKVQANEQSTSTRIPVAPPPSALLCKRPPHWPPWNSEGGREGGGGRIPRRSSPPAHRRPGRRRRLEHPQQPRPDFSSASKMVRWKILNFASSQPADKLGWEALEMCVCAREHPDSLLNPPDVAKCGCAAPVGRGRLERRGKFPVSSFLLKLQHSRDWSFPSRQHPRFLCLRRRFPSHMSWKKGFSRLPACVFL